MTRAQFTIFLVRADGLAPASLRTTPFVDVSPSAWYAPSVDAAFSAGLAHGITSTTFDPRAPITREQMAVMLARLLGSSVAEGSLGAFTDASSVAPWALAGVRTAVGAGLLVGFPNGSFQPAGLSTRAEAAAVLAKYLTYIGKV